MHLLVLLPGSDAIVTITTTSKTYSYYMVHACAHLCLGVLECILVGWSWRRRRFRRSPRSYIAISLLPVALLRTFRYSTESTPQMAVRHEYSSETNASKLTGARGGAAIREPTDNSTGNLAVKTAASIALQHFSLVASIALQHFSLLSGLCFSFTCAHA